MEFYHPAFAPAPAAEQPAAPPPVEETTLRLREVAVAPLEEFMRRPGATRPICAGLAAILAGMTGKAMVTSKGIRIDRQEIGGVRVYWHPESIVCNDLSRREQPLCYSINRQCPDVIHLMDMDGRYLESLPLREMPGFLDQEALERELAAQKRVIRRAADHLQRLHGEESREILEAARANSTAMQRAVTLLDAPPGNPDAKRAPSPIGQRLLQMKRQTEEAKSRHASAVQLGRAIAADRVQAGGPSADESFAAEDWSDLRSNNLTQTPEEIESW